MSNVGPLQIFSQLSNLTTLPELTRFVSAFVGQISTQFNNLLSNRMMSGAVSATGSIVAGENYGASLVSTGVYFIKFNPAFSQRPAVVLSAESNAVALCASGVTTTGFLVSIAGTVNNPFSFIARGEN